MPEVYRKQGRVVRFENGRMILATESGEAIEDGVLFTCAPTGLPVDLPEIDPSNVEAVVRGIEAMVEAPVAVERLIVTEGNARHWFGGVEWMEQSRRVHVALTCRSLRAMVDLGDFDLSDIGPIARGLAVAGAERDQPQRVRLAPGVTAALLPFLLGVAPPNVTLHQPAGGVDGKGGAIEERRLDLPPWPNWYRPSYRVRPVQTPLNVRISSKVTETDPTLPLAVALLAPVSKLTLRVLCVEGQTAFPATLRVSRIESAGTAARWYPHGAGSFGVEMVL